MKPSAAELARLAEQSTAAMGLASMLQQPAAGGPAPGSTASAPPMPSQQGQRPGEAPGTSFHLQVAVRCDFLTVFSWPAHQRVKHAWCVVRTAHSVYSQCACPRHSSLVAAPVTPCMPNQPLKLCHPGGQASSLATPASRASRANKVATQACRARVRVADIQAPREAATLELQARGQNQGGGYPGQQGGGGYPGQQGGGGYPGQQGGGGYPGQQGGGGYPGQQGGGYPGQQGGRGVPWPAGRWRLPWTAGAAGGVATQASKEAATLVVGVSRAIPAASR